MEPLSNTHSTVAPWPGQDDGDAGRQQRGIAIAALVPISKDKIGYRVPSQSSKGSYIVTLNGKGGKDGCSCPDYEERQKPCKHLYAVQYIIQREELADGSVAKTRAVRATYKRDWPAYNSAQSHEGEHFVTLLRALCDTVPQPPQRGPGRPRLPISDVLFAVMVKVYSTMSTRRAMSDLRAAHADGVLDRLPGFASLFRFLEDPGLTPILEDLIERSALPLRAVEVDFAVDSSGFATKTYIRWFDKKWGREVKEAQWIKAHLICGVKTKVVTSAKIGTARSNDSPYLPTLVEATAQNFDVQEVSGDKAYSSHKNLQAIEAIGAVPYVPFKWTASGTTGDALWDKMYHYYSYNRAEFLAHYHKRSNVETVFSMIKAKFGAALRTKTPTAQTNEGLAKVLAHNIVVLIHSMYELGINPEFGGDLGAVGAEEGELVGPASAPY